MPMTTKTNSKQGKPAEKPVEISREPGPTHERNPGVPLNLDIINDIHINRSAVERRAATLGKRRTVKKEWQAAWLLRAVSCIDLTTLAGDDTPGNVIRLCAKARQPVRQDLLDSLGVGKLNLHVGAVCVYHNLIGVSGRFDKDIAMFKRKTYPLNDISW